MKKKPTEWEEIFTSCISSRRMICKIFKRLKSNNKKQKRKPKYQESKQLKKLDYRSKGRVLKRRNRNGGYILERGSDIIIQQGNAN